MVLFVRHAAVDLDLDSPASTWRLSEEGRTAAAELATRLAPVRRVLTSPLLRARQTAAEIAKETGATVRVEEALAPGATAATLSAALTDEAGPVTTVGHQPDCSEIALAVLGRDPGFPVAGMAELELIA